MRQMILAVAVLIATTLTVSAKNQKISGDTQTRSAGAVDVIVQFKHTPTAAHAAKITSRGGSLKSDLSLVNALHVSMPSNRLQDLASDPEVAYISPNRQLFRMHSTIPFDVPSPAVNAPYAWTLGFTGQGISVAVIDSGTQDSPDLQNSSGKNRITYKQSYITGVKGTVDVYGHGTHVAGLIAGNGAASSGQYEGVAPEATILNLRVLDDTGMGQDSYVISAIQAAIKMKTSYNLRVINLSLGRPVYESYTLDPLCQAVEQAWRQALSSWSRLEMTAATILPAQTAMALSLHPATTRT